MKLLDKSEYSKLIKPIQEVAINTLFAEAVINHKINGQIFVDEIENPKTYYIIHPYGMSLLFGDCNNELFNNAFRTYSLNSNNTRNNYEWMQAFPDAWHDVLAKVYGEKLIKSSDNKSQQTIGIIELNSRVNFEFNQEEYFRLKKPLLDNNIQIIRTNSQAFKDMPGSVVPSYFWATDEEFLNKGVGFSLYYNNKLASTAYSAFVTKTQIELGIETVPEFRGMGLAQYTCQALIDYCIEHHYEPVWACRLENIGSYKLAQKLGFKPTIELPYYRLSK